MSLVSYEFHWFLSQNFENCDFLFIFWRSYALETEEIESGFGLLTWILINVQGDFSDFILVFMFFLLFSKNYINFSWKSLIFGALFMIFCAKIIKNIKKTSKISGKTLCTFIRIYEKTPNPQSFFWCSKPSEIQKIKKISQFMRHWSPRNLIFCGRKSMFSMVSLDFS